jgi:hypothetical protein
LCNVASTLRPYSLCSTDDTPLVTSRTNPRRRVAKDRNHPLQAYVTPDEREAVKARAAAASMTLSAYIRAACLGARTISAFDRHAVAQLAKINADQGRLGGLLKMYLQDQAPDRKTAEQLLSDIRDVQAELKTAVKAVRA